MKALDVALFTFKMWPELSSGVVDPNFFFFFSGSGFYFGLNFRSGFRSGFGLFMKNTFEMQII